MGGLVAGTLLRAAMVAMLTVPCGLPLALADGGWGGYSNDGIVGGRGGDPTHPDGHDGTRDNEGGGGGGGSVDWATGTGGKGGQGGSGFHSSPDYWMPGGAGGIGGDAALSSPGLDNTNALVGNDATAGTSAEAPGGTGAGAGGGGGGGFGWAISGTGSARTTAPITGGAGGKGAGNSGAWGGSGGGGEGGGGVLLIGASTFTLPSGVALTGGVGGMGGAAEGNAGYSGYGGDGGTALVAAAGGKVTSDGTLTGGVGGTGGESLIRYAADGGAGGAGASGNGYELTNHGLITGGQGGTGGRERDSSEFSEGGHGGAGGAGGSGVTGAGFQLFNDGQITGGAGGKGGGSDGPQDGSDGQGGPGIRAADAVVVNSGQISGDLAPDGVTRANAIEFTDGTNRLELRPASLITGNVIADGGADTLALGGGAFDRGTFDVAQIGAAAQYRGFEAFEKTGVGLWSLLGDNTDTDWTVSAGVLNMSGRISGARVASGILSGTGSLAGTLTLDGGVVEPGTSTSGGILAPGATDDVGALRAGALAWHSGGVRFQLRSPGHSSDSIALDGELTKAGAGGFLFHFQQRDDPPQPGQVFPLITFDHQTGFDAADFSYDWDGQGLSGHFELEPTALNFVVTTPGQAQTITFANPGDQTLGTGTLVVTPTADSGLPVALASLTTEVCTASGAAPYTVTLLQAGTCTLQATQGGNAEFAPADPVQVHFAVRAGPPGPPGPPTPPEPPVPPAAVAPIPTLSQWALVLLAALLATIGIGRLRAPT